MTTKNQSNKDAPSKCAHPGCSCPARPGEKYCSEFCENIAGSEICRCEHSECKTKIGDTL